MARPRPQSRGRATSPAKRRPAATPRARRVATRSAVNPGRRTLLLLLLMVIAASLLIARLVYWQVMQYATMASRIAEQRAALYVQPPMRGMILDSSGTPLATDATKNLVYAVPKSIKEPHRTAVLLAPVLGWNVSDLEQALTGDDTYRQLAPEVSDGTSQKIRNLGLPGIALSPIMRRAYPGDSTAANVLGFVDVDGKGQAGIEQQYDTLLSGKAGLRSVIKDTAGNDIKVSAAAPVPAQNGAQLQLSIDGRVQALAENDIQRAVKLHRADSGSIIVMDPRTGFILAMASTPTYNPNQYYKVKDYSAFQNPAVQMQYEPGSTYKIITMAAGLDSGVITPNTSFYDNGVWRVDGITLRNWNGGGFGQETMTQVLQHSANVGASYVANLLGTTRFYSYVNRFGFGRLTGIDTAGEIPGAVPLPGQRTWTNVNLYTNSFGQGIAVTPIQMVRAVAAVANGGRLMKPQLVKRIVYGGRIIDKKPVPQGRAISARTARTLTGMLVQSAIGGEAQLGLVKGYNIAAKTGTANIAGPDGRYISNATIGSIIGYAPAYRPRFVVLVIVKRPRDQPWGSMTAAPVMSELFQQLFLRFNVPPNPNALNK